MPASAVAVSRAGDAEALRWEVGKIVALRGRIAPTQLARASNPVSPDSAKLEVDEMA